MSDISASYLCTLRRWVALMLASNGTDSSRRLTFLADLGISTMYGLKVGGMMFVGTCTIKMPSILGQLLSTWWIVSQVLLKRLHTTLVRLPQCFRFALVARVSILLFFLKQNRSLGTSNTYGYGMSKKEVVETILWFCRREHILDFFSQRSISRLALQFVILLDQYIHNENIIWQSI